MSWAHFVKHTASCTDIGGNVPCQPGACRHDHLLRMMKPATHIRARSSVFPEAIRNKRPLLSTRPIDPSLMWTLLCATGGPWSGANRSIVFHPAVAGDSSDGARFHHEEKPRQHPAEHIPGFPRSDRSKSSGTTTHDPPSHVAYRTC